MATGIDALNTILAAMEAWAGEHGRPPTLLRLPALMAWDLTKCARNELGDLHERLASRGTAVLEVEGFRGMHVVIVHGPEAQMGLE